MVHVLNALFQHGARLVPLLVAVILLAALWVGRRNRGFLPRGAMQIALHGTLLVLLALTLFAAYFAARVRHELAARVAGLDLRMVSTGAHRRVADYAGKVVVLSYWATWCPHCRAEMTDLDALAAAHRGDDVVVLTVTDESVEDVRRFESETAPILAESATFEDTRPATGSIGTMAYEGRPTTLILGRDGAVRALFAGAESRDTFESAVFAIAGERPAP